MKKISAEQLYEAMDGIGDDLIARSEQEAAEKGREAKGRTLRRLPVIVTAFAALIVLGIVSVNTLRVGKQDATNGSLAPMEQVMEQGSSYEAADAGREVVLGAGMKETAEAVAEEDAAPAAFFVLDGTRYVETERVPDDGTVAGAFVASIPKAPEAAMARAERDEGAKDMLSTDMEMAAGDVYLVNGRDKEDALCMMDDETGTVLIFESVTW